MTLIDGFYGFLINCLYDVFSCNNFNFFIDCDYGFLFEFLSIGGSKVQVLEHVSVLHISIDSSVLRKTCDVIFRLLRSLMHPVCLVLESFLHLNINLSSKSNGEIFIFV